MGMLALGYWHKTRLVTYALPVIWITTVLSGLAVLSLYGSGLALFALPIALSGVSLLRYRSSSSRRTFSSAPRRQAVTVGKSIGWEDMGFFVKVSPVFLLAQPPFHHRKFWVDNRGRASGYQPKRGHYSAYLASSRSIFSAMPPATTPPW
jgi:hypothetical protein